MKRNLTILVLSVFSALGHLASASCLCPGQTIPLDESSCCYVDCNTFHATFVETPSTPAVVPEVLTEVVDDCPNCSPGAATLSCGGTFSIGYEQTLSTNSSGSRADTVGGDLKVDIEGIVGLSINGSDTDSTTTGYVVSTHSSITTTAECKTTVAACNKLTLKRGPKFVGSSSFAKSGETQITIQRRMVCHDSYTWYEQVYHWGATPANGSGWRYTGYKCAPTTAKCTGNGCGG